MPELPEVETITRALSASLTGKHFTAIKTFIAAIRYPLDLENRPELVGQKIISVRRRARYIIIELKNRWAFVMHLGMSGAIRIVPADEPKRKHDHVFFHLSDGMTMRYECPRRFGFIKTCLLDAPGAHPSVLVNLGVEPLSDEFTPDYLYNNLQKRSMPVKNAIMDNKIVVGVGNIYAAESLFLCGISPLRKASTVTKAQCVKMVKIIKEVLKRSIEAGGTTISDYKQVDGSEGKFVQQLKMYGKDGQPCPECGTIVQKAVLGGRSSCFCPKCQK